MEITITETKSQLQPDELKLKCRISKRITITNTKNTNTNTIDKITIILKIQTPTLDYSRTEKEYISTRICVIQWAKGLSNGIIIDNCFKTTATSYSLT